MVGFDVFVKRFGNLQKFIIKRTGQLIKTESKEIIKMMKEQHLAGVNREGNTMQTGYSVGYGKRRKKKGLQTKFVDLHFTGKYHKSLDVVVQKEGFDIQSKEPYAFYLRKHFPGMAGLTEKNAVKIAENIAEKLAPEIKKYLVT